MKAFIFYIMNTFKWFIVTTSSIICALMVFALLFSFTNNTSNQIANLLITLFVAIVFGAFSWNYEKLLKKIAPKEQENDETD